MNESGDFDAKGGAKKQGKFSRLMNWVDKKLCGGAGGEKPKTTAAAK